MIQSTTISKIRVANHEGDKVLVEYDRTSVASVEVAQDELTRFLEDCVERFNTKPPVWARRAGQPDYEPFDGNLQDTEEVFLHWPLIGG